MVAPMGSSLPILGKLAQRNGKIYKEEEFSSRHIAEIKDAFEQILDMIEQKQREIDQLMEDEENGSSRGSRTDSYDETS